ncbi:MAG: methyltransferase domain-containing protein [Candidatus Heimdallarchaeota archaeon]
MMEETDKVNWGPRIHEQFVRQASWTKSFRYNIYRQIGLTKAKKILEVGCGTGVITRELREKTSARIVAIDKDAAMIKDAKSRVKNVEFLVEDVENLSMKDKTFDIIISQYLFLWLSEPSKAVSEMVRVCKKRGYVVALAEPDYGGWIEYPKLDLGKKHIESISKEGADPFIGRKILSLFETAGLEANLSVIAQVWDKKNLMENIEEEWKRVLEAQLITEEEFRERVQQEIKLIKKNKRMIFMPVFSAVGRKK